MNNIDFLTEILTTEYDYWCASKTETWTQGRSDVSVWLICIPQSIRRGLQRDEILLTDLEKLRRCDIPNIPLSDDYPPFQAGTTLYNFTRGFPVTEGIKKFLIDAIKLSSKDLNEYKELYGLKTITQP